MILITLTFFKNPSYPEYIRPTPSGAMCLDIHPAHPHMVVVGLYDGNVCVFNLQRENIAPMYISDPGNGKHKDSVCQVDLYLDLDPDIVLDLDLDRDLVLDMDLDLNLKKVLVVIL